MRQRTSRGQRASYFQTAYQRLVLPLELFQPLDLIRSAAGLAPPFLVGLPRDPRASVDLARSRPRMTRTPGSRKKADDLLRRLAFRATPLEITGSSSAWYRIGSVGLHGLSPREPRHSSPSR